MPARKKGQKLTIKEAKFVQAKVNGQENVAAYKQANYKASNDNVARVESSKLLSRPNIQEAIDKELKLQNITLRRAIVPISDALDATQEYYDKNGEQHFKDDHSIRLKASNMALQLMGLNKEGVTVNLNFGTNSNPNKYIVRD